MKWLLEEDLTVVSGFLFGTFLTVGIFTLLFFQDLFYVPFIIVIVWIYTLVKRAKIEKQQQKNKSV